LRKELEERTLEISMLKSKHLIEIDKIKANVAEAMEVKLQAQLVKQFRIFDDEKAELWAQIRELEVAAGDYKKIKEEYEKRTAITKWLFIAKIRSIRTLADQSKKVEATY
jgi:hypothetical protein